MSPHGAFPPQLVNLVIDELNHTYQNRKYPSFAPDRVKAYKTLHACALVSKKWTARSRAHLFEKVRIETQEGRPIPTPPAPILLYIKRLEIRCGRRATQVDSTAELLKAFSTSPIEHLGITGGVLADKRIYIQEFIAGHSATLHTVKFKDCSLSAHNIGDIVLGRHNLKCLQLVYCECEELQLPDNPLTTDISDPGAHPKATELELSITGGDAEEGPARVVAMVAQLPYRFSTLRVDHVVAGDGATEATNALIKANGCVLSSLRIHLLAGTFESLNGKVMLLTTVQSRRRLGDRRRAGTSVHPRVLFQPIRTYFGNGTFRVGCRPGLHLDPLDP